MPHSSLPSAARRLKVRHHDRSMICLTPQHHPFEKIISRRQDGEVPDGVAETAGGRFRNGGQIQCSRRTQRSTLAPFEQPATNRELWTSIYDLMIRSGTRFQIEREAPFWRLSALLHVLFESDGLMSVERLEVPHLRAGRFAHATMTTTIHCTSPPSLLTVDSIRPSRPLSRPEGV